MPDPTPISIADLLLDEENPRLDTPNQGQRETIRAMADFQGNRLQVLAKDIVDHGLDPSDLFIVMELENRRYVVLDGNRRVTALKTLENPDIVNGAVSSAVLGALKRLSGQYHSDPTDAVLCIVVRDRAEADHWIELKHTGYQDGAGPLRWGPDEGARFRARTGGQVDAETQALNFLQRRGEIDQEFRSKVPTTTFRRLLRTPTVRQKIGVDWKDGTLEIKGPEEAVATALLHIAQDLANGKVTVRDLNLLAGRVRYVESLPAEVLSAAQALGAGKAADTTSQQRSSNNRRANRVRDRLIPGNVALNVSDPRIQDIEKELKRLSLQQYPNAVSVLFRVFLELSADAYIEETGLSGVNEDSQLGSKLLAVTRDLVAKKKLAPQQAKVARRAAQRDSYLGPSITGMNQYVHNKHLFPAPSDLRADWDNLQPWFKAVWGV